MISEVFAVKQKDLRLSKNLISFSIRPIELQIIENSFIQFRLINFKFRDHGKKSFVIKEKYYFLKIRQSRPGNVLNKEHQVGKLNTVKDLKSVYKNLFFKKDQSIPYEKFKESLEDSSFLTWIQNNDIDLKKELDELCATILCKTLKFISFMSSLNNLSVRVQVKKFLRNNILLDTSFKSELLPEVV